MAFAQHLPEHRPFLGIEAVEEPPVVAISNFPEFGKNAAPLLCQVEQLAAVVRLQGLSCEPLLVLKLVEDFGYGTTGQANGFGKLGGPDLRMLLDLAQHDPLGNRDLPFLQGLRKGSGHMIGDAP
jgi:hypothetical protein